MVMMKSIIKIIIEITISAAKLGVILVTDPDPRIV
jgi:hypothetical protein